MKLQGKFCKLKCKVKTCEGCEFWVSGEKGKFPNVGCYLYFQKNKHKFVDSDQLKLWETVPLY